MSVYARDQYSTCDKKGVIGFNLATCGVSTSKMSEIRVYSCRGKYLLVPNTPVEICINCGMIYYDAAVLKEIERRFFAIQENTEKPEGAFQMS